MSRLPWAPGCGGGARPSPSGEPVPLRQARHVVNAAGTALPPWDTPATGRRKLPAASGRESSTSAFWGYAALDRVPCRDDAPLAGRSLAAEGVEPTVPSGDQALLGRGARQERAADTALAEERCAGLSSARPAVTRPRPLGRSGARRPVRRGGDPFALLGRLGPPRDSSVLPVEGWFSATAGPSLPAATPARSPTGSSPFRLRAFPGHTLFVPAECAPRDAGGSRSTTAAGSPPRTSSFAVEQGGSGGETPKYSFVVGVRVPGRERRRRPPHGGGGPALAGDRLLRLAASSRGGGTQAAVRRGQA